MAENELKVPPLRAGDRANFDTLKRAALNGDLALVSAIRKADQKPVALVAAMFIEDGQYNIVPLATMAEGDPYELFEDPTVLEPEHGG